MASIVYTSFYHDSIKGNIDTDVDTFKALLTTSSYTPSKNHTKRSDITNEITGTGYTAGGVTVTPTLTLDTVNNKVTLTFSAATWTTSTLTAQYLVVYKSRGGASSADELVACVDFGGGTSTAGTFTVTISTPLTIQN